MLKSLSAVLSLLEVLLYLIPAIDAWSFDIRREWYGTGITHGQQHGLLEKRQAADLEFVIGREERLNNIIYANISIGSPNPQIVRLPLSQTPVTWVSRTKPDVNPCSYDNGNIFYRQQKQFPGVIHRHIKARDINFTTTPTYYHDSYNFDCLFTNWTESYDDKSSSTSKRSTVLPNDVHMTWKSQDIIVDDYFMVGDSVQDVATVGHETYDFRFAEADNFTSYPQLGLGTGEIPFGSGLNEDRGFLDSFSRNNDVKAYSIYLNDLATGNGQLNIGAVDVEKYSGNLTVLNNKPSTSSIAPLVDIQKMEFFNGTGFELLAENITGSIGFGADMATSPFWAPGAIFATGDSFIVNIIANALGTYDTYGTALGNKIDIQSVSCSQRSSGMYMSITIEGVKIKIDASHLLVPSYSLTDGTPLLGPDGEQLCRLMVTNYQSVDDPTEYNVTLGTPFLQAAYVVFDLTNNQTSFAPAVFNATKKNIVSLKKGGVNNTPGLVHLEEDNSPTLKPRPTNSANPPPGKVPKNVIIEGTIAGVIGGLILFGLLFMLGVKLLQRHRRNKPVVEVISELPGATRPIQELHESVRVMGELPGSFPPLVELPADCSWEDSSTPNANNSRAPSVRTAASSTYSQPSRQPSRHQSVRTASSSMYSQPGRPSTAVRKSSTRSSSAKSNENWI